MTMKKIQLLIYVMVAMCMTLHSCQKNEPEQPVEKGMKVVHFYAEEINTKTAFDDPVDGTYPTLWTANDENVKISLNYATAVDAEVIPSDDNKTASFKATMEDDESGSYQFYAMSPSSAQFNPISSATKSIGVVVPATQTHIEGSVDEAAQILFAKSETTAEFPESVNLSFKHALAYGKISFSNLDLGDAVITSVSLTASKNIAGRYNYNFETATLTENSASSTITINTSNKSDIWFACAPVDLSNGGTMKFVIHTNAGTYTRMVTFPADKGNFEAGNIAVFSVNMQGIELVPPQVYTLVKDKNSLTVDSEVIIVAQDADYAISTTQNTNNRAAAGIKKTGETVVDPADNVQVLKLVKGNIDNTVALSTGDKYLYAVDGSNHLKTGQLYNNASWLVSIADEGVATIQNAEYTSYSIQYNSGNSIFSCYKTAQQDVCIYKLNGSGTAEKIFLPELSAPEITVTVDNETKRVTVEWEDVANATSYEVVCGDKSQTVATGVQICTFVMDDYGSYNVTVTASAEGYASASGSASAELSDPSAQWQRVTSINDLTSGGTFIIGYEASANSGVIVPLRSDGCEATTTKTGKLWSGASAGESTNGTIDMSNLTTSSSYEVTISSSTTTSGAINIQMADGKYIGNSGSKNTAKLYATASVNTDYTPTIGDNNVVTLTSPKEVSETYTTLQYNTGSPRFANYGGTQKNVVIYKKK